MTDFAAARRHMVDCQLLPNKVTDEQLIAAVETLPRELFVPKALRGVAYLDEDLPVTPGRFIMEPMIFTRMIQAAAPTLSDAVLDVGCTTGYSTAVLARLSNVVVAVEDDETLAAQATQNLADAAVDNAAVIVGPLPSGYGEQAPYDVIVLEGAVPEVPEMLLNQLGEGGRLVAVVQGPGLGKAVLFTRTGGVIGQRELFDAGIPLLPGFEHEAGFVF